MNRFGKLVTLLLATAMLLSMMGCQNESPPATATTAAPEPSALEIYQQAVAPLQSSDCLALNSKISRKYLLGTDSYAKQSDLKLLWNGKNTEQPEVKVTGTSTIGEESVRFSEVFRDGTVYLSFSNTPFFSEMSLEEFTARWPSATPLDESLYGTVVLEGSSLRFEAPTALESWAAPEYSQLISATAIATLDEAGTVSGYRYTAHFRQGAAVVELDAEFTVKALQSANTTLDIPASDERYVPVDTPAALHLMWEAQTYLSQAPSLTAELSYDTFSQAMGAGLTYTVSVASWGSGSEYTASMDSLSEYIYYDTKIQGYRTSTLSQSELFQDGVYSVSYDGETPAADESITADAMEQSIFYTMSMGIPTSANMIGATCLDLGGIALIELKYDNVLAQAYSKYVCDMLADDEYILDNLSTNYQTKTMTGYIAINLDTGLPTASGISFGGTHTIDGADYDLSLQISQSYFASDPDAYELLTGESLPEQAPEQSPTPLLYQVTDSNGQKMWLFGTIHVGDDRTGHLPQEIYNALDGSAALAVEFDPDAFDEMLEEDPQLMAQIATAYIYTDGTTTVNHLDASLYTAGLYLLKAAGMDQTQAMLLKPVIWSQFIDDLYMRQGYLLTSSKGMDLRLMNHARSNGIPIRNVESGLAQLQMLTGFSDNVQEMLLASSVATTMQAYNQELEELYDLWCQGDEAALTAYLQSEDQDIPQYQLAAYNEYNKAMMTDRNKGMLEAAKSYLESGEVVFYAVGLAHLLGEDGLVNTLRQAGYTVEAVQYAP